MKSGERDEKSDFSVVCGGFLVQVISQSAS
jgi:hypothetical protein